MLRLLLVVAVGLGAGLFATPAEPPQAPAPRRIPVEELVEQLGTGPVAQREEAERRLSALAVDPPPEELLAALKSKNLDQRDRAKRIVQVMRWNVAAARLPRGVRFAEQGRADLFVAATAVWDLKADDDRLWTPAQDLGRTLLAKADRKGGRRIWNCPSDWPDFAAYKKRFDPLLTRVDKPYTRPDPKKANPPILYRNEAIQAPEVLGPMGMINNLIVARGRVWTERSIQNSVIFANGDVTADGIVMNSAIVCDGDVTVNGDGIGPAVVIARGNILIKGGAMASDLIAGGKVAIEKPAKISAGYFNVIKENEPNPLGFVTFFELHRIGLEVKAVEGEVRVAKVAAGSACAKAGLKVGDVLLEAGGKKPDSAESLRRLLRDALAIGDAAVKLKRGEKTETVKLALPE